MRKQLRAMIGASLLVLLSGCTDGFGVDQYGQKVTTTRLKGQWLVINYWAQWCPPCRKEIPELNLLASQLQGQGVVVLGVNFDGLQGEALEADAQALGIHFTVLARDPAKHFGLPRSEALPVTFIVDGQGQLREQLLGEQTAKGLMARLASLRGSPAVSQESGRVTEAGRLTPSLGL